MAIKITQQTVTAPVRKLNATWTMEKPQTLKHTVSDEIEQMIQEEINSQILADLYRVQGWYLVPLTTHSVWTRMWTRNAVTPWLLEHYPDGGYHLFSGGCMFRDKEMAVEFELTWT